MSKSDQIVLEKSLTPQFDPSVALDEQWLSVNDSNNGSYNGSINIDTTVLSNSQRWIDYRQAVLEVPVVLAMTSDTDISAVATSYIAGLKSGHHQLIDSMSVDIQNVNAIQQQTFTNFHVSYKVLEKFSQDTLEKYGDVTGIAPDSEASFLYNAGTSLTGNGFSNNTAFESGATQLFTTAVPLQKTNDGLRRRLEQTSCPVGGYGALGVMTTAAQSNNVRKTYHTNDGGSGAARIYTWYIMATIRLRDVHDFFDKMPLSRGVQMRFRINYNSARVVQTCTTSGTTQIQTSVTQLSGQTVPFMLASAATTQPMQAVAAVSGDPVQTWEYNVSSTTSPAASHPVQNASLSAPAYLLDPRVESEYLSLGSKRIEYDDIYEFTILDQAAGASFNSIISNGILEPQQLVIIPQLAGTAGNNGTTALVPFQSVFDSSPATTCPLASISNFNVLLSGKAVYQQNQDYDYEEFLNEVAVTGVMGGQEDGIASGLISFNMWQNGYRYYVVDLSRRLKSEDRVPISIQVQGTNNTSKIISYYIFCTYRRSLSIDIATGAISL